MPAANCKEGKTRPTMKPKERLMIAAVLVVNLAVIAMLTEWSDVGLTLQDHALGGPGEVSVQQAVPGHQLNAAKP